MQQQQQQQQQQRGGSQQYGAPPPPPQHPELSPFPSRMLGIADPPPPPPQPQAVLQAQLAEAASPISSRPPPPATASFEELIPSSVAEEEALGAGEDGDRGGGGGSGGNRWPRQETLALLKIRSDMDAAFRDATLKGPLWDEVSRKLGELGYKRSAKKCKEKFENVQKYYKRTKEGRAGRQDGKTYRFFSQLEALHAASGGAAACTPSSIAFAAPMSGPSPAPRIHPIPISSAAPPPIPEHSIHGIPAAPPAAAAAAAAAAVGGFSFSSNTSSSNSEESDDETEEEEEEEEEEERQQQQQQQLQGRKRKRRGGGGGRSGKKMMAFFEGLMRQVMERQEEMQKRFLETLEKREQDRAMREDAWRRQETARLAREQELLAQERAMAASRAAAVVSFIQKISGQTIQLPAMPDASITVVTPSPAPPPPPPQKPPLSTPPPPRQPQKEKSAENAGRKESASTDIVVFGGPGGVPQDNVAFEAAGPPSSRWPKTEVHALIKLRTGLDTQYQEMGPKGPLWEEISARMRRLGYNRSSKRCKEKWENINKYFKKVKESNKKRPEDAKTCPYFHQLDALYRRKLDRASAGAGGGSDAGVPRQPPQSETNTNAPSSQEGADALTLMAAASSSHQPPSETDTKNNGGNGGNSGNRSGGGVQTSNGGLALIFATNKTGDAVTGEGEKIDEGGSDNMDHDYDEDEDDEDDEDEERGKMQFEIQFQRQSGSSGGGGGGGNSSNNTSAPTTTTSSFLAMVHQ